MKAEDRVEAARRLNDLTAKLITAYAQHTTLLTSEVRMKIEAFESHFRQTGVVAASERMSEAAAKDITINKISKMGEIKQLEEERDNLRFLIKYDLA